MLSWLVDKSANIVKSKQMIVVNMIRHRWAQIYPCPHYLKVYDIQNIDRSPPPPAPQHEINQLFNKVHSKGKANLRKSPTKVSQVIIRKALINVHQTRARHPSLSSTQIAWLHSQRTSPLGRDAESRYSLFGPDHTGQYHTCTAASAGVLSANVFTI